jgi:hypothetical protein
MASRAPAETAAVPAESVAAPTPSRHRESPRPRTALKVSSPSDAAEREAEATARRVMRMPVPARVGPVLAQSPLQPARAPMVSVPRPQAPPGAAAPPPKARPPEEASPELESAIKKEKGGGRSLPADVVGFMAPRFKADFSGVRIHTGGKAENLATRLGARAFTFGRDIFFNAGQFQPATPEGMELIAHELTHTIQQREVVQREVQPDSAPVEVRETSSPQVQRGIVSEALDWIADKANVIPGYRLLTIVIGRNPINMSTVSRSGANILRALIEFIPGGGLIVQALENHGVFEKGGKFIEEQFAALGDLGGAMRDALMEFIDSLGWRDIFRLGSLWGRAKSIFTVPVEKAISFGKNLVSGIAEIVKDAILKPLGRWAASNIPKWDLLVGVFGKNPISDEGQSPASALIGGFMELIGQREIWDNIQKSGAVGKAWAWFQGAMKGALALVTSIPGRVMDTIRSLTIFDIVTIAGAFRKVFGAFASFVGDFMRWAGGTVLSLLEIIFSVVAPSVVPYLKKAGGAFSSIIKAPGRFVSTLVKAGKQGFNQFKAKIASYLRDALFKWLLGSAEGAGIYFPKSFAPLELLKLGLSVLGLTWAHVRTKLVAATNETTVKALETGFDLVKTLVTQGPAAAWEELLKSLSNLKAMVIDAAIDFVKGEVVKIAIEKLVSFLTPAGAFIQAVMAIFRTIMFIVNKLSEIGRLVAAFIDGLAALANGVVTTAAGKVESVLATGLSLAISFLASFAGLGNIPKKVMEIIKKLRAPVDKALNAVIKWIVDKARKLGKWVAQAGVPHDPNERLKLAARAALPAARALKGKGKISAAMLERVLGFLKTRYALSVIQPFEAKGQWMIRLKINPETVLPSGLILVEGTGTGGRAPEGPNWAPIVAKLRQAVAMFTNWAKLKTAPVAQQMLRQLETARDAAYSISQDQAKGVVGLQPRIQALAAQLRAIQTLDPKYELVSVGEMSVTITSAKRQAPRTMLPPWNMLDPSLKPKYESQLKEQEEGMNAMLLSQIDANRATFLVSGRGKKEAKLRKEFRKRGKHKKGAAAPHNPDKGWASGYDDPTGEDADSAVNSHIGSQGPGKVPAIMAAVNAVSPLARLITQANFGMTVV